MENNRKLNDCMVLDDRWHQATFEILVNQATLEAETERQGNYLAFLVNLGEVSIEELRGGIVWANALDKETVDLLKVEIDIAGVDQLEATARRIAHHAGRFALRQVKTSRLRFTQQVKIGRRLADFGSQCQGM